MAELISGKLSLIQKITGKLSMEPPSYPVYPGSYEVTPKVDEQVLPTENCLLTEDLVIRGIPIYETTNLSGGKTIIIAMEEN